MATLCFNVAHSSSAINQDTAVYLPPSGGVVLAADKKASGSPLPWGPPPRISIVLQNHGVPTADGKMAEAAAFFVAPEKACQVQLVAHRAPRRPRERGWLGDGTSEDHSSVKILYPRVVCRVHGESTAPKFANVHGVQSSVSTTVEGERQRRYRPKAKDQGSQTTNNNKNRNFIPFLQPLVHTGHGVEQVDIASKEPVNAELRASRDIWTK